MIGPDPTKLIDSFGLIGLGVIVFAESGLLVGFFLPGDSILFTAGLLAALHSQIFDYPIMVICGLCFVAAVLGDQVGYRFGTRLGPAVFARPKSLLFKPENATRAKTFFDRHGPKTILIARFVPIVRTFVPVVAGIGKMNYRVFSAYNLIGGLLWGAGVPVIGYSLGRRYPSLKDRLDVIAVAIVLVSLTPVAVEIIRHRRRTATGQSPEP